MAGYEADRVVVELIANVDKFDARVTQSASNFDSNMNKMLASGAKGEAAAANMGKGTARAAQDISKHSQAMKRDFVDLGNVLAGPTSPFVMPVKQGPAVASAMRLVSTGASVLGGIMGGLVAGGVLAAAAALAELIFNGNSAADVIDRMVKKLEEDARNTQLAKQAKEIFATTLKGVTAALSDNEEALKKLNDAEKTSARQALESAIAAKLRLAVIRAETLEVINQARAHVELAEAQRLGGQDKEARLAGSVVAGAARANLDELEKRARGIDALIGKADRQINEALSRRIVELSSQQDTAAERINKKYDKLIEQARERAVAEGKVGAELKKQTDELNRQRQTALAAAREKPKGSGYSGREVSFEEAAAIARGAGFQVNSAQRSYAQQKKLYDAWVAAGRPADNPVAPPGTSAHEGAKGRWALDIQLAPGLTAGKIKKVFAEEGVAVNVFPERGHLHVSGSRTQAAAADREAARQAEAAIREQNRFEETKSRLNDTLLAAQGALVVGFEAQAEIAKQQVLLDEQRLNEALQNDVEEGNLTQAHADELKLINERIAIEKIRLIEREKQLRLDQARFNLEDQGREFAIDDLEFAEEMARSQEARREIQLQILDAVLEQKRLELEHAKDLAIRNGATKDEIAFIQAKIDRIPYERAEGAARINRSTMGPIESFLDSLPQTAAEANEALEQMAVGGIQSVVDGLAQAGTEWIKLGGTAGKIINQLIADLIRLVLYQSLIAPLLRMFSPMPTNPFGSGPAALPSWLTGPDIPLGSAKGNVFGPAGLVPFAQGGIVSKPTIFPFARGIGLMGEAGDEAIMPLGRDSQGNLGVRIANDRAATAWGGRQAMVIVGVQANDFFEGKILQVTGPVIARSSMRAAQGGAALARDGLARKTLHRLG